MRELRVTGLCFLEQGGRGGVHVGERARQAVAKRCGRSATFTPIGSFRHHCPAETSNFSPLYLLIQARSAQGTVVKLVELHEVNNFT